MVENTSCPGWRSTENQAEKAGLQAEQGKVIFGRTPQGQPLPKFRKHRFIEGIRAGLAGEITLIKMNCCIQLFGGQVKKAAATGCFRRIEQMGNL